MVNNVVLLQDPGSECPRPECTEPQGFGAIKSGGGGGAGGASVPVADRAPARLLRKRSIEETHILDVRTEINTIEILDEEPSMTSSVAALVSSSDSSQMVSSMCLSPIHFSFFLTTAILLSTILSAVVFCGLQTSRKM